MGRKFYEPKKSYCGGCLTIYPQEDNINFNCLKCGGIILKECRGNHSVDQHWHPKTDFQIFGNGRIGETCKHCINDKIKKSREKLDMENLKAEYRSKYSLIHIIRDKRDSMKSSDNSKDELNFNYLLAVCIYYEWRCFYCSDPIIKFKDIDVDPNDVSDAKFTFDRIDSSKKHVEGNLVLACDECNRLKGKNHPYIFMLERYIKFNLENGDKIINMIDDIKKRIIDEKKEVKEVIEEFKQFISN